MTCSEEVADDEGGFSDVSSICEDEHGSSRLANKSRWLGRVQMAERAKAREEASRKQLEEMKRKLAEDAALQKQRQLEAITAGDDETESEAGSGFSDVSKEGDEGEGPDPYVKRDDSDEEVPGAKELPPDDASDDFGNSSEEEEETQPQTVRVVTRNDDSDRVQLLVQVTSDAQPQEIVVRLRPGWAPLATARFLELVEAGFYNGVRFHRVVKGALAQFGLPADPAIYAQWRERAFADEQQGTKMSNSRCTLSFATRGPSTRCCQVFVNLCHNKSFDQQGCTPFAEIVRGMEVVDDLFGDYGEAPPRGTGPDPDLIKEEGLAYLGKWPRLSYIVSAEVLSRSGDNNLEIHRSHLKKTSDSPRQEGVVKRVSFHGCAGSDFDKGPSKIRPSSPPASRLAPKPPVAGSGTSAVKALRKNSF